MTRRITVTATGDALITRRVPDHRDEPFRRMVELIRSADVAFTNMEMVLSRYRGSPVVESGGMNLSAEPGVARDLQRMGFNLIAFANNHTLNYGEEGCLETLRVLEELEFVCAGAGRHLAEARMPAYLETPAGRIGLVACASTFAPGQRAGLQRGDAQGRPGLNPQRFDTLYVIDQEHMEAIRRIADRTGAEKMRQHRVWLGFGQPPKREGEFIFYSVGNFFFQYEYLARIPSDDYETLAADSALSPGEVMGHLSRNETQGFPADRHYWETVLPLCTFEERALREIRLYPLTLVHHRRSSATVGSGLGPALRSRSLGLHQDAQRLASAHVRSRQGRAAVPPDCRKTLETLH